MMNRHNEEEDLLLVCMIVNFGLGSKIAVTAREEGLSGATILLGRGTVQDHLLKLLGITDRRKEIVLMAGNAPVAYQALNRLREMLQLDEPNHGIAFTIPISQLWGTREDNGKSPTREGGAVMYNAIYVIVDLGKSEAVIEAANAAGSRGATVIHGRGAGAVEAKKLFGIEIEPEKEIVLIVSEASITENIVSTIRTDLSIDEPGKGIIFVQDIKDAYGIRQEN